MVKKKNSYTGKNRFEKQAYGSFILGSENKIDKTEEEKDRIFNTDESSIDEDESKKPKIKPKSSNLKISDFLKGHILESFIFVILTGIIVLLFTLYSANNRELGELSVKLNYFSEQIKEVSEKYNTQSDKISGVDKLLIEINKDLEYLKQNVQNIINQ